MKRWCALFLTLVLTGCAAAPEPPRGAASASLPAAQSAAAGYLPEQLPAPELSPEDWALADFPGCSDTAQAAPEAYALLAGTELENSVTVLRGAADGPAVYIVAGVHGDEEAGWRAGNLLKQAALSAGTLYILSPANLYGAEHNTRFTKSGRDLNRSFPGDGAGWDSERMAAAIFSDIRDKRPALVLDLHEAQAWEDGRDALGNTVVCQSLDGIGDLILDLIAASESGALCAAPLSLYGSPPAGSVNRTAALELGVPVVTVETSREEPLAQRVRNHLELAEFVLTWYGLN